MTTLLRITVAFDIPLGQLVRGLPRPVVLEEWTRAVALNRTLPS